MKKKYDINDDWNETLIQNVLNKAWYVSQKSELKKLQYELTRLISDVKSNERVNLTLRRALGLVQHALKDVDAAIGMLTVAKRDIKR